jgi:hypothetical protein
MFSLSIIFIDQDSEGEVCHLCKKEIKGKKWIMMIDSGDPVNFPPDAFDEHPFCTICKIEFEKGD